ncbi:Hsp70 family protein [Candidatus Electronema sp. PJ]|uniref:Hsp70 family protein n=1 Tax=Candidatus Electronema sp. PJ TaxID=3401572 RepID=UPI003AA97F6D
MKKSIGIDLGTTNSAAAIKKIRVEVLKNAEGDFITPSCVTVRKRLMRKPEFIVGRHALEWLRQEPENTITAVKRLIGRNFHDQEVQDLLKSGRLHCSLSAHSHGSHNSIAIQVGGREFSPEEISAQILAKIKADAERVLGDEVATAVITVPAYFNDKQKHATRTAAALAGLKVSRLLPEPTAAAISFGVDQVASDEGKTVLVFDFGGGTLDLSLLAISGGQIIEIAKGGDMWLGGEDIDGLIISHVLRETADQEGMDDIRLRALIARQEPGQRNRLLTELKLAAEKAKISLSNSPEASIVVLGLLEDEDGDPLAIEVELCQEQLEELLAPTLELVRCLVRNLLADAHFTADLIDHVLLVGGSSRIPCVIKILQQEFGADKVLLHERPMLAVAEGAAILSHRLSGVLECPACGGEATQNSPACPHCKFDLENYNLQHGLVDIVHAAAHDYFIRLENNSRFLLIKKNTPLPCSSTEIFQLVDAEQELVHMQFYNVVNGREESIGDLWLGIDHDSGPASTAETAAGMAEEPLRVAITLDIDENNLVSVRAALCGQPEVKVSGTLSRGKADEKLFLLLESIINEADQKGYSTYTVADLLCRARGIIRSIHQVVDERTGEVNENLFRQIAEKISKAGKIAEAEEAPLTRIYYAESMLTDYGMLIEPALQMQIRKKVARLREVDEEGTCEETMQAMEELAKILENPGLEAVHALTQIESACEICHRSEPDKAKRFMRATAEILAAAEAGEEPSLAQVQNIMPEVEEVLDQHARSIQKIHRGIRK